MIATGGVGAFVAYSSSSHVPRVLRGAACPVPTFTIVAEADAVAVNARSNSRALPRVHHAHRFP
jgi:hypothetical protein